MNVKKTMWWVVLIVLVVGFVYTALYIVTDHQQQKSLLMSFGTALELNDGYNTNLNTLEVDIGMDSPLDVFFLMMNIGMMNENMGKFGVAHFAFSIILILFLVISIRTKKNNNQKVPNIIKIAVKILVISALIVGVLFAALALPEILFERKAEKIVVPLERAWSAGKYEGVLKAFMYMERRFIPYMHRVMDRDSCPLAPKITGKEDGICAYIMTPEKVTRIQRISFGMFAPKDIEWWYIEAITPDGKKEKIADKWDCGDSQFYRPSKNGLDVHNSVAAWHLTAPGEYRLILHVSDHEGQHVSVETKVNVINEAYQEIEQKAPESSVVYSAPPAISIEQNMPSSSDKELARAIIEEAWVDALSGKYYARRSLPCLMAHIDIDRAIAMTKEVDDKWGITAVGYQAPRLSEERAGELLKKLEKETSQKQMVAILSNLAKKLSTKEPARAKEALEQALSIREGLKDQDHALRNLVIAAHKLNHPSKEKLAKELLENGIPEDDTKKRWLCGGVLAILDPDRAMEVVKTIKDSNNRQHAMAEVIITLAPVDWRKAKDLYEKDLIPARSIEKDHYISMAGKNIVRWMRNDDLSGALELANSLSNWGRQKAQALVMIAEVTTDKERALIRYYNALMVDDKGKSLQSMRLRFPTEAVEASQKYTNSMDVAYYLADVAPDICKERIETVVKTLIARNYTGYRYMDTALAMARINPERAVQIARTPPVVPAATEKEWRPETKRKLAQYLLTTEEIRRSLEIDRWGATDGWTPGDETGW